MFVTWPSAGSPSNRSSVWPILMIGLPTAGQAAASMAASRSAVVNVAGPVESCQVPAATISTPGRVARSAKVRLASPDRDDRPTAAHPALAVQVAAIRVGVACRLDGVECRPVDVGAGRALVLVVDLARHIHSCAGGLRGCVEETHPPGVLRCCQRRA